MGNDIPVKRVLVTSGPTKARIDRIRYIANTSSGVLGAEIVKALVQRGTSVVHVFGEGSATPSLDDSPDLESICVSTVDDLVRTVGMLADRGDISAVVHAMAVLDYVPESYEDAKKPSGQDHWDIRLVKTPKAIALIRDRMPGACMVGFKLESGITVDELTERAGALLGKYNLDLVVANLLERVSVDRHEALAVGPGKQILGEFTTKTGIAGFLAEFIGENL